MRAARCSASGCVNQARCAVSTTRTARSKLKTTLYYDDRAAPKSASRYCKACAVALLPALCTLVDEDAPFEFSEVKS